MSLNGKAEVTSHTCKHRISYMNPDILVTFVSCFVFAELLFIRLPHLSTYASHPSIQCSTPNRETDPRRPGDLFPPPSSSSYSSSSSSCLGEKHDRPRLYYRITLRTSIKKKGLFMPARPRLRDKCITRRRTPANTRTPPRRSPAGRAAQHWEHWAICGLSDAVPRGFRLTSSAVAFNIINVL